MSRTIPASPEQQQLFADTLARIADKVADDERTIGVEFPQLTAPDGSWITLPASLSAGYTGTAWSHGNWFCGFWVGLLLASYLRTGDRKYLGWTRERMRLVAQRADDGNTHDIGFIFDSSAIPAFHVTGDPWYANIAMRAADKLRARIVNTRGGSYLASWGPLDDARSRCSSAIDTMANLSLLYWATRHCGDGSYRLAAEAHAQMTAKGFIRADKSTYHAVEYDTTTGERVRGYTFQGFADESAWSRGQGWAIYGYVISARETGKVEYLELAEELAQFYLKRLGDHVIPPYDFDAAGEDAMILDTAAAAVVASALIEMGRIHPGSAAGEKWGTRGVQMLERLCREAFASEDSHRGALKHSCYSRPHKEGVDSATMFGDFFFVEALCRVALPGRFRATDAGWMEAP